MSDEMNSEPPVAKYRYTLTITGNSHDEIADRLRGVEINHWQDVTGYTADRVQRDEFDITDGTATRVLEHTNPDQTPERYHAELMAWVPTACEKRAKAEDEQTRIANGDDEPPALEAS